MQQDNIIAKGRLAKNNYKGKPLVTVVTVVFNAVDSIEQTILSVVNQTFINVEYIIIDGGSTDGTLDIIKKYENAVDYWLSEPDKGIYDAMNKGIDLATGQWINFMNAGDLFAELDVLRKVFEGMQYRDAQIIYGDHIVNYGDFSVRRRSGDINDIWKGSQFCHQSAFIRSSFHYLKKYNTDYKITADFNFFFTAHEEGARFVKVFEVISIITPGGVSDTKRIKSVMSRVRIVGKYNCTLKFLFYYADLIIKISLKEIIKKLIPKKFILKYISKGL